VSRFLGELAVDVLLESSGFPFRAYTMCEESEMGPLSRMTLAGAAVVAACSMCLCLPRSAAVRRNVQG